MYSLQGSEIHIILLCIYIYCRMAYSEKMEMEMKKVYRIKRECVEKYGRKNSQMFCVFFVRSANFRTTLIYMIFFFI